MNTWKEHYTRNLPHWQPKNGVFNICFRLEGSLPKEVVLGLKQLQDVRYKELSKNISDSTLLKEALRKEHDLYFGKFDELLDKSSCGPKYLSSPDIAQIVFDCLLYWHEQQRYKLICFTIMPNHVHVILYKIQMPLFSILQTIKSYTAKLANRILDKTGLPFWMQESYDNLVRDRKGLALQNQLYPEQSSKSGAL
jgi:hypothetical protein